MFNLAIVDKIANLTDYNYHADALIVGAKMLGYERLVKVFTNINEIADQEGGYDKPLMDLRFSRYQELMKLAKSDLTFDQYKEFYGAY